jgi:hypothetical protein
MARTPSPFPDARDRLLDPETLESPRRLSRDEHRAVAGPDWSWTHGHSDEEDTDA